MMGFSPNYKKPFSTFVKKQHKPFQAVIEDEVASVCDKPDIGEAKTGDLTGIYVHKFKHKNQEYLMAYHVPIEPVGAAASQGEKDAFQQRTSDFLFIDFYKLGTHENFYDDLKTYLRANGWYK
ncbi:MAG: type II toxin-antitoxin system RelE/ParE family toxin [Oxalobacteraceae bacterium]